MCTSRQSGVRGFSPTLGAATAPPSSTATAPTAPAATAPSGKRTMTPTSKMNPIKYCRNLSCRTCAYRPAFKRRQPHARQLSPSFAAPVLRTRGFSSPKSGASILVSSKRRSTVHVLWARISPSGFRQTRNAEMASERASETERERKGGRERARVRERVRGREG